MGSSQNNYQVSMQIHVFIMFLTRNRGDHRLWFHKELLVYRVVAYVRYLGGQQVYIYFHKEIRPMPLRMQPKDACTVTLTVDESISTGCLQREPTYLYVLRSAIACSTRILYFRIKELNFRHVLLSTSGLRASCADV